MKDFEEMPFEEVLELVEGEARERLQSLGYDTEKIEGDGRQKPADEVDAS